MSNDMTRPADHKGRSAMFLSSPDLDRPPGAEHYNTQVDSFIVHARGARGLRDRRHRSTCTGSRATATAATGSGIAIAIALA
jgi:hypothetical protein